MKKNKVAILTFQETVNFGAQLQAYALQKTISNFGYDVNVLDYRFDNSFRHKIVYQSKLFVKGITLNKRMFKKFKKEYCLSSKKYDDRNIKEADEEYDVFVTGSDQVFNPNKIKKTTTYLLGFTDKNKISYAASFGVDEIEKQLIDKYKKCLLKFSYVSIREKTGCELYKKITSKNAELVLDPTLLLSEKEWREALDVKASQDDYVLIYMLEYSPDLVNIGKKYAKDKNLKYKIISGTPRIFYYRGNQWNMSPQKFVKLFLNAKCIFTNSFHGVVFSINYNKEFYVKLLVKNKKVNNRLTDMLEKFNLSNRIIETNTNYSCIDYKDINNLLEKERKFSKNFLHTSLRSCFDNDQSEEN